MMKHLTRSIPLAAALALFAALPAFAYTRVVTRSHTGPRVVFHRSPHMVIVPGTTVYTVRQDERPDYDVFRVGNSYYAYDNGYWYRSSGWRGPFMSVRVTSVPQSLHYVPRDMWTSYPSNWYYRDRNVARNDRYDRGRHRGHYRNDRNNDRYDRDDDRYHR